MSNVLISKEFKIYDCDDFIVRSIVYGFHVQEVFLKILEDNQEHFQRKPLAMFVVCQLGKLSSINRNEILKKLPTEAVVQAIFKGYREKKGDFENQESKAVEWENEIGTEFKYRMKDIFISEVMIKNV